MPNAEDDEVDLGIRQYAAALGYFQYENTTFWTRNQLFLVAHSALVGLVVRDIPMSVAKVSWARLYTMAAIVLAALALAYLWHRALDTGEWWIALWTKKLEELEPHAFGGFEFQRNPPRDDPKYVSAKKVARNTARVFVAVWMLSFVFLVALAICKYAHYELL